MLSRDRETKIGDFACLSLQEYIGWFEVPVYDTVLVYFEVAVNELLHNFGGLLLRECLALDNSHQIP